MGKPRKRFSGSNFGNVILSPAVVVCIGYRPMFNSNSVYYTAYVIDLFTIDSAKQLGTVFKIGEDVRLRAHVPENACI